MIRNAKDSNQLPRLFFSQLAFRQPKIGFHIPGHIGARFFDDRDCRYLIDTDTTELSSTDDLHDPSGPVLDSLRQISEIFGSEYSVLLCSGSTTGIKIMLSSVLDESSVILLSRAVHMAVVWTLSIIGCRYLFLPSKPAKPSDASAFGIPENDALKCFLSLHPDITDVFVTSPDYYGRCADLRELSSVAHRFNCRLLVDEAHGAHFAFGGRSFPRTAMNAGADISVQSLHKTLPALTPAAVIHVSEEAHRRGRVSRSRIFERLCAFETSSPSFMIAASAELAISRMKTLGVKEFEQAVKRIRHLSERVNSLPGLAVEKPEERCNRDPMRLVINTEGSGRFATHFRDALEQKGIDIEFSDPLRLVLIFSVLHKETEYEALFDAISEIVLGADDSRFRKSSDALQLDQCLCREYVRAPESVISLREAVFGHHKYSTVAPGDCAGMISAKPISFYPPGVPVIWPGERVPAEIPELLLRAQDFGIHINGLEEGLFVALST
ncbi:MAG: aminotransferase class I/II-fold pyridoxal phosphate-dependent enzyme [Clostridiales bacterium]|nr:aminotransferase class I/II-fold pyridoxal phosphate-dependent enzyme [Clostridiales bacterium]